VARLTERRVGGACGPTGARVVAGAERRRNFWLRMMKELQAVGVLDILIAAAGGVPKTTVQPSTVQLTARQAGLRLLPGP